MSEGSFQIDQKNLEDLKRKISQVPKVDISATPTKIQFMEQLSKELGDINFFIKREDLTGKGLGGNKVRQCDYRLAPGVQEGADVLISGGSMAPNNLSFLESMAAKSLGWEVYLVFREQEGATCRKEVGNRYLELLADVQEVEVLSCGFEEQIEMMFEKSKELKDQNKKPYVSGPTKPYLGGFAYVECFCEIIEQMNDMGINFDYIILASGGATAAGLIVSSKYIGFNSEVISVNPGYYPEPRRKHKTEIQISEIANSIALQLGLNLSLDPSEVNSVTNENLFEIKENRMSAIKTMARTEGVFLDPIYSGAAFEEFLGKHKNGFFNKNSNVLFLHTGGYPALFTYKEEILRYLD